MAGPATIDFWTMNFRFGSRRRSENDGRFELQRHRFRHSLRHDEICVCPIGMIKAISITGIAHQQSQFLYAMQVNVNQFGGFTASHNPAFPKNFAVANN